MASTRNTNTPITDTQGRNVTKTHLSTNIIIKVNGNAVGAVKSLQVTETRTIQKISEIGTDGIIDSAPSKSTEISVTCNRTRFSKQRIAEAFGRGFIHAHSQRYPFDIEVQDIFADANEANAIITVIENCWIERIDYTYDAENFIISESMGLSAERINSTLNGSNVVSETSNGRSFPIVINPFEAQADRGEFTGALDAAGLLNAFLG